MLYKNRLNFFFIDSVIVRRGHCLLGRFLIVSIFVSVLFLCSCSSDERGVIVSGKVMLDGTPISAGQIHFLDRQTKVPVTTGIRNGKYSVHIEPGEKTVKVFAERVVGKIPRDPAQPNGEMIDQTEQYVPKKFNVQSKLTVTIIVSKEIHDFNLNSSEP
ncbi:MAG: hypothetical protein LBL62_06055 [Planctomycetaceae bacterium]|jgi:hypothetical protein|nr:hypothetical protein [Planctomycetaceae bacterium]